MLIEVKLSQLISYHLSVRSIRKQKLETPDTALHAVYQGVFSGFQRICCIRWIYSVKHINMYLGHYLCPLFIAFKLDKCLISVAQILFIQIATDDDAKTIFYFYAAIAFLILSIPIHLLPPFPVELLT